MSTISIPSIPQDPLRHPISIGFVPAWVVQISLEILNGTGGPDAVNHIGMDVMGDIVLYRKVTDEDRHNAPLLKNIEEIWVSYDFPAQD